ncbi:hypothetical protein BDN72DRAFT_860257 [Pluteus cervinus]|uniref:Uncharacterized protein n=1 Tax=Pluteus cervinus TaxID=181527 RepID=A0ACD3AJR5_9AGAR|nr:hypothetical protein BDN72DRAFT_860257 [Pluteus cervinus]
MSKIDLDGTSKTSLLPDAIDKVLDRIGSMATLDGVAASIVLEKAGDNLNVNLDPVRWGQQIAIDLGIEVGSKTKVSPPQRRWRKRTLPGIAPAGARGWTFGRRHRKGLEWVMPTRRPRIDGCHDEITTNRRPFASYFHVADVVDTPVLKDGIKDAPS